MSRLRDTDGPAVTVVLPIYNGQRYLSTAIESVLAQSVTTYEIIAIDDGSVDGSREIVKRYLDRLVFIEQTNHGVCHARNVGLARARGRYIAFLDADDVWKPHKLERQIAYLDAHPEVGLLHSDLEIIDDDGRVTGYQSCSGNRSAFSKQFLSGHLVYPSAVMIRTNLLREVKGFSEDFSGASYEDIELWVRLAARCAFACVSEPLVSYRIHASNNTKNAEMALRNRQIFLEKVWTAHGGTHRRFLRGEFAKFYSDFGKSLVRRGQVDEGRRYLKRAILTSCTEAPHPKTLMRACLRFGRSYVQRS